MLTRLESASYWGLERGGWLTNHQPAITTTHQVCQQDHSYRRHITRGMFWVGFRNADKYCITLHINHIQLVTKVG